MVPLNHAQESAAVADTNEAYQSGYQLGAGDRIEILVYGESDLSLEVRINQSGRITYPFLGELVVLGATTQDLEITIVRGLVEGEFLVNPDVTVNITEYRPFYVNGEVQSPGSYPFQPGLTLLKAITIAGGFTERASRSRISVLSANDSEVQTVESLDMLIGPDDIIIVNQRLF
jgi:polysaccharide export outer membrane protein